MVLNANFCPFHRLFFLLRKILLLRVFVIAKGLSVNGWSHSKPLFEGFTHSCKVAITALVCYLRDIFVIVFK